MKLTLWLEYKEEEGEGEAEEGEGGGGGKENKKKHSLHILFSRLDHRKIKQNVMNNYTPKFGNLDGMDNFLESQTAKTQKIVCIILFFFFFLERI